MRDYFDLKLLPKIDNDRHVMQSSSFDRREENADFGQFLYKDSDGSMVMLDEKGRGCVKSIWAAVTTDECELKFYFDGSDTPKYTCPLKSFFEGAIADISGPANTFEDRGHGGDDCRCGNCFVPIPYENGLKITASGKTDFYYHIMYERYASDAPSELTSRAEMKYLDAAFDTKAVKCENKNEVSFEKEVTLSEKYNNVFSTDKPGVITEFTVEYDEGTDLSNVKIDMFFDKNSISTVACPLLAFFAQSLGYSEIHSSVIDVEKRDGRIVMTSRFPIPYWRSAGITLVDLPRDSAKLTLRLKIEENTYDKSSTGHFYADYREGATELYDDWLIGEFSGRGNVVGLYQTCVGDQWCEGNEHFYIDGAMTPQINGTGTEDLYLGCYWPNRKYDSPTAGCVNDVFLLGGSTIQGSFAHTAGYYRFFRDMPISFSNGIKLAIQHGAVGQTYSDYTSLCFSYRLCDAASEMSDFLLCASESSLSLHSYASDEKTEYTLTSKVEADRKAPIITKKGFLHKDESCVSFKAALLSGNKGAVLRRVYDKSHSPQSAEVYVDGKPAGVWHDAGFNDFALFADSDFYIPAYLTKDKSLINIELRVRGEFTDFEYKIFTLK